MSHGDRVTRLPDGFTVKATSENAPFAVASDEARRFYSTMFHPEVVHTPDGGRLIRNFVIDIAGIKPDWSMTAYRSEMIAKIRQQVGAGRVLCALSGGVDSAVAAKLIHEAVGDQLTCVYVDHGLMRAGETEQIVSLFRGTFNIPLIPVDASALFLGQLAGVTDPEVKRKTIGRLFIEVFDAEARKIASDGRGPVQFLAQGTLYPDVIESVSFTGGPSVTIKSHHNVGGLPERMNLKLVEPLRELFKDECVLLAASLACLTRLSAATLSPALASPFAFPARSRAKGSTSFVRRMRSISMKSARPAFMTPSGRLSPFCCPCARLA